ncbi:MAG: phospholipase [Flavobacteriaceae bacterium]
MLEYIKREPIIKSDNPPLLILLHGYGSNEQDLFSFASQLPDDLLIISAKAPLTLGFGSYAWYSINFEVDFDSRNDKRSDTKQAKESIEKIEYFIDTIIRKYKVNTKKVFLLGFSQGSILSYAVALRNPDKIPYIIALSGYINSDLIPKNITKDAVKNLNFFISHGNVDQVLPIEWARKSLPILNTLEIKYQFNEYPVGHGVNPQNFNDFKEWIIDKL